MEVVIFIVAAIFQVKESNEKFHVVTSSAGEIRGLRATARSSRRERRSSRRSMIQSMHRPRPCVLDPASSCWPRRRSQTRQAIDVVATNIYHALVARTQPTRRRAVIATKNETPQFSAPAPGSISLTSSSPRPAAFGLLPLESFRQHLVTRDATMFPVHVVVALRFDGGFARPRRSFLARGHVGVEYVSPFWSSSMFAAYRSRSWSIFTLWISLRVSSGALFASAASRTVRPLQSLTKILAPCLRSILQMLVSSYVMRQIWDRRPRNLWRIVAACAWRPAGGGARAVVKSTPSGGLVVQPNRGAYLYRVRSAGCTAPRSRGTRHLDTRADYLAQQRATNPRPRLDPRSFRACLSLPSRSAFSK